MKAAAYILMEPKGIEIITDKVSSEESIGEAAKYIPLDFFNCEKTSSINEISELICGKIVDIDKTQKIDELIFIGGNQETVLIEEDMDKGFTRRDIEEVAESYTSKLETETIDDYEISFRKLYKNPERTVRVRICLFPKYIIRTAEKVSKKTGKKCRGIFAKYEMDDRKNVRTNYYDRTKGRITYKRAARATSLVLAVMLIYSGRYILENRNLERRISREIEAAENREETDDREKISGYGHMYGTDVGHIEKIISENPVAVQSINAENHRVEAELVSADIKDINKLVDSSLYRRVDVEYIRSEEISREEAKRIYGIGERNEESNQETREKEDNKEKTEEKSNQGNKDKRKEKNNKEENYQAYKSNKEEKSNRGKRRKDADKKENSEAFRWKKESEKNQKNKVAVDIFNSARIYAAEEEEAVKDIESDEFSENSGLNSGYVENSDKLNEKREQKSKNNPQDNPKSNIKETEKKEKEKQKTDKIKVYFIKIKAII